MEKSLLKILLVDDDQDYFVIVQSLLSEIRSSYSYELEWADTYDIALEKVGRNQFDICLFDYFLGERNGLELLREIREKGFTIPVILLTGLGDHKVDLSAMKAGAADFLEKHRLTAPLLERSLRYAAERHKIELKLTHLANYDVLTGLPNRWLLQDRLSQALARARRENCQVAILFLDLDRFKVINDTLGHSAGDLLLRKIAVRLTKGIRECDTIARFGGDEFMAITFLISQAQSAARLAQRILKALLLPFNLHGQEVFIKASIGIALYPIDGTDLESLVKCADSAMYQAKSLGGNTYSFFSPEINTHTMEKLIMESKMHRALEREEFLLYFQPQFDIQTGRMCVAEALLRWQPLDGKLVLPAHFIPLLEETGLIIPVGEWVLGSACAQCKAWQEAGMPLFRIGVNISARQLKQEGFVDMVKKILHETGLDPFYLELEITENMIMENILENIELLDKLKGLRIHIAMDDFGTGFSSLKYLKNFPIDRVKIDRSFITHINNDPKDESIVRTIIALAHNLGMKVVAEGVETEEQFDLLTRLGCDEVQGYYFGKPVPAEEFIDLFMQY